MKNIKGRCFDMYMEILKEKEIIFKSDKKEDLLENLMYYLFESLAHKNYKFKMTRNYNDLQVIKFTNNNDDDYKLTIIFYNVPTKLFCLDVYKIFN